MHSGVHCATEDFSETKCCEYQNSDHAELKGCMQGYRYCSVNIHSDFIKELTCPEQLCQEEHQFRTVSEYDTPQYLELTLSPIQRRGQEGCRIVIDADRGLNGVLNV